MSDFRDGMEVGDDEEMSSVGSPPEADDVYQQALAQNEAHLEEYEEWYSAHVNDIRKEASWMGQFGFKPEYEFEEYEWRETAAIKRYSLQYEAAGLYLDALAQVVAVVVPRVVTASTQIYATDLEQKLPMLRSRYETLVHPPAKFVMNVGIHTFNLKEWRSRNASARMGSLMWHLECAHCAVKDLMQRANPEMWWVKHSIDRLQRPERELKQVEREYGESVLAIRKSRKRERVFAMLSMYRRTRTSMQQMLEAFEEVQRDALREHADTETRSLDRTITTRALQVRHLMAQLPEPSSFYRERGSVCELDENAFTASYDKILEVVADIQAEMVPMKDQLDQWHKGHFDKLELVQTLVWQAYKDKMKTINNVFRGPWDNWSWSSGDDKGDLTWKKRLLRNQRPRSEHSFVSR